MHRARKTTDIHQKNDEVRNHHDWNRAVRLSVPVFEGDTGNVIGEPHPGVVVHAVELVQTLRCASE